MSQAQARRNKQLAAIHVMAHKRLHLDRETYVALLQRVGSVSSSADLDARGRGRVLDELRWLAGEGHRQMRTAVPMPDAPQNVRDELVGMVAKVCVILAETGKSWNYAHGTARRMFHVQRVEWLKPDQLHKLVAALSYAQRRVSATKETSQP